MVGKVRELSDATKHFRFVEARSGGNCDCGGRAGSGGLPWRALWQSILKEFAGIFHFPLASRE